MVIRVGRRTVHRGRRGRGIAVSALPILMLAGVTSSAGAQSPGQNAGAEEVILITGSTDGLGRAVAVELAEAGVHIAVHGRNRERGLAVVREVEELGATASFYQADLADLAAVQRLAEEIRNEHSRLDVLVNNAGIWLTPEQGRRLSVDGVELHFAVNYLSHYLLTRELLPLIRATPNARIVNVASVAQQPIDFDDVMLERGYSDGRGYAQSKLAQVLFTFDLAEELEGSGILVNALHPATMMNTTMVVSRGASAQSDIEEGVEAVVHLVRSAEVGSGGYYNGTRPAQANPQAYDQEARGRLRRLSDELTRGF